MNPHMNLHIHSIRPSSVESIINFSPSSIPSNPLFNHSLYPVSQTSLQSQQHNVIVSPTIPLYRTTSTSSTRDVMPINSPYSVSNSLFHPDDIVPLSSHAASPSLSPSSAQFNRAILTYPSYLERDESISYRSSAMYPPMGSDGFSGRMPSSYIKYNPPPSGIPSSYQSISAIENTNTNSSTTSNNNPIVVIYRKNACAPCYIAKTSCDGRRPCERCLRLDREHLCVDRPPKTTIPRTKRHRTNSHTNPNQEDSDNNNPAYINGSKKPKPFKAHSPNENGSSTNQEGTSNNHASASSISSSSSVIDTSPTTSKTITSSSSPSSTSSSASYASYPITPQAINANKYAIHSVGKSFLSAPGPGGLVGADERTVSEMMMRIYNSEPLSIPDRFRQASSQKNHNLALQYYYRYMASQLHPDHYSAFVSTVVSSQDEKEKLLQEKMKVSFRNSPNEPYEDSPLGIDVASLRILRVSNPVISRSLMCSGCKDKLHTSHAENQSGTDANISSSNATPETPTPTSTEPISSNISASSSLPTPVNTNTNNVAISESPAVPKVESVGNGSAFRPVQSANRTKPGNYANTNPSAQPNQLKANVVFADELELTVQVNREFERKFGYSQRQVKELMIRDGPKGLFRLYRPDSLACVGQWLSQACLGETTEFKAYVWCVNKWKGEIHCVVDARFVLDPDGLFYSSSYAFTPLPEDERP